MKTVLVTGSNGQLGSEIRVVSVAAPQYRFLFTDYQELDITNREAVRLYCKMENVDFIVNCAAYTAVDRAEVEYEAALQLNAYAVQNIGDVAAELDAKVIHVSTDYVFDGMGCRPYTEDHAVAPSSAYGRSKAEGERLLLQSGCDAMIIRTSWLYSSFGANFVKTMIRLGKERSSLSVVADQVGTPTYAADLAGVVVSAISEEKSSFPSGVFHYSNEGVCSWYDFTCSILRLAGVDSCKVVPISTEEYPTAAARPAYSVLNKGKIKRVLGVEIPHWEESLRRCISLL